MDKQMNLELGAKRQRVSLQVLHQPSGQPARPRVLLIDDSGAAVKNIRRALEELELTPWVEIAQTQPPVAGDWEVEDRARGIKLGRCYYSGKDTWTVPGWPFPKLFGSNVFWRGLSSDPAKQPKDINWEAPL